MPPHACNGARLRCSHGIGLGTLSVLPVNRGPISGEARANITDSNPLVNIGSIGLCTSLANPMVSSASASAHGVPTPVPCVPMVLGSWQKTFTSGPGTMVGNQPALDYGDVLLCQWGGLITLA